MITNISYFRNIVRNVLILLRTGRLLSVWVIKTVTLKLILAGALLGITSALKRESKP